jgi:hypothetical protein
MQSAVWYRAMPGTTETMLSDRADEAAAPSPVDEPSLAAPAAEGPPGPPDVGGAEAGFVTPGVGEPATAPASTEGVRAAVAGAVGLAPTGRVPACALEVGVDPVVDRVKEGEAEGVGRAGPGRPELVGSVAA